MPYLPSFPESWIDNMSSKEKSLESYKEKKDKKKEKGKTDIDRPLEIIGDSISVTYE